MTPNEVAPMQNKIATVLKIGRLTNQTEGRSFIGNHWYWKFPSGVMIVQSSLLFLYI